MCGEIDRVGAGIGVRAACRFQRVFVTRTETQMIDTGLLYRARDVNERSDGCADG